MEMNAGIYYLNASSFEEGGANESIVEYLNKTLIAEANSTDGYVPYKNRLATYIIPMIFALIFIIGVLGNGCLILIFFRHRAMRNVPNTYILSLAIADLLVIVTAVPFTSVVFVVEGWPWGELICKASEFFKDLSIGVSVFTLTALSGDRFFAIVDPLRKFHSHSGRRATRITIGIAVLIWILAGVMGIPSMKASHVQDMPALNNMTIKVCYPFPEEWGPNYPKVIVLFRFACFYAVPLFIIGIFYVLIAKHLIYSASHVPGEIQGAQRQVKARRKVAMTVLTFVVIFGICFLPSHLFMIWFYYNPHSIQEYNDFWHVLRMVGFILSFANSCTNPVALYCVSGAFRKHFNRYLLCQSSSSSRRRACDKSGHREMTITSQSTIYRRYTSKKFNTNQSIRSRGAETTIILMQNGMGEENGLINHDKMSCI